MKQLLAQLTPLTVFLSQHWVLMLAACYPLLVILNDYSQPSPERIYQGQPFFYSWYMNWLLRTQILIVVGLILFCTLLLRIFWAKTRRSKFVPPAVFFGLSLLIILVWALTPAIIAGWHIATKSVDNQTKYNLYARPLFNPPSGYEFVLVKCDSLGLLCQFAERWERETARFDASNYSLRFNSSIYTLYVNIHGANIITYPLE